MRKYEFRGKRKDNGEWVYGNLVIDDDKYYICLGINEHIKRDDYEVYMVEVDPETVGQYTEQKDKNEAKIYDGDIVYVGGIIDDKYIIIWNEEYLRYYLVSVKYNKNSIRNILEAHLNSCIENVQVIGNTHDNPELLEGK